MPGRAIGRPARRGCSACARRPGPDSTPSPKSGTGSELFSMNRAGCGSQTRGPDRASVRRSGSWVPMRAQKRMEALHEPYSQVIGNEQNNRDRFMASIHVRILEVFPIHEPPLSRPAATLSPPCGERAGRGVPIWFMAPMRAQILEVPPIHEPNPLIPSFSPNGGEGARRAEGGDSAGFMERIPPKFGGELWP